MIHDVATESVELNTDERGHLGELYRSDWDLFEPEPEMAYYSMTYPDIVRAWHRHKRGKWTTSPVRTEGSKSASTMTETLLPQMAN